jgi:hypothetical protein
LSWSVAQDALKSGYLTYRAPQAKEGFFTLMLVPPKRVTADKVAPKEMIFVIDCSGSQNGPPLDKCKETMNYILDHMNADDTFQIIAFSNGTRSLSEHPEKVSDAMKAKAHKFIAELQANGGTWMAPAVEQACKIPADSHRLRIVTFMTDGFVGNDFEILGMVKKLRGVTRWFPFGTGNSVNRMLIDGIAKEGGGEPDYVLLNTSGEAAGKKFYDRIASPVLTDVKLNIEGVTAKEVYPKEISDVWAERPLYFKGKYTAGGAGTITLTGYAGGKPYEQKLAVNFPDSNTANPGIASLWARAKVDRLMSEDYTGAQNGAVNKELKDEIVETALAHHIMTQYTSFVAVDEKTVVKNGKLQTITVPVEMPDGVSREAIFGETPAGQMQAGMASSMAKSKRAGYFGGSTFHGQNRMMAMKRAYGYAPAGAGGAAFAMAAPQQFAAGGTVPSPRAMAGASAVPAMPSVTDYRMASSNLKSENRRESAGKKGLELNRPAEQEKKDSASSGAQSVDKSLSQSEDDKNNELSKQTNLSKLSAGARLLLKNASAQVKGLTRKGDRIMVVIKVQNVTADQKAALKALGLDIVKGKEAAGEVKGLININKLAALANLDFVLSVLLDSDLK